MRVRAFTLFVVLLLPASLSAQRIHLRLPWIGPRPPAAVPLPPQAPVIARELRYRASRFSTETYAAFGYAQPDHSVVNSGVTAASMLGFGARLDWRFKPALSVTGDLTTALWGGPMLQNTFDFGGRYRPVRGYEYKLRPYFDLRASWAWSYASFAQPFDQTSPIASPGFQANRTTSHGLGALVGTGFETFLTPNFALTTGLSLSRYRMSALTYGQQPFGSAWNYRTTAVRLTLGLKYNRGRMVPIQ